MSNQRRWSNLLRALGGLSLVVGSFDPMEGSALILPGSALLALGSYLGAEDRRTVTYRTWSFVLVAIGVGALFGLSALGGVGGTSGHSVWWSLLILPYLIGWSIDVWGPGSARWISKAGLVIGTWYTAIGVMLWRSVDATRPQSLALAVVMSVVGLGTIVACVVRLRKS